MVRISKLGRNQGPSRVKTDNLRAIRPRALPTVSPISRRTAHAIDAAPSRHRDTAATLRNKAPSWLTTPCRHKIVARPVSPLCAGHVSSRPPDAHRMPRTRRAMTGPTPHQVCARMQGCAVYTADSNHKSL